MDNFNLKKFLGEKSLLKENKIAQAIRDEAEQEDSKVGAAIFNKYAKKIESAPKEDYRKILTSMERELIDTHPDTFDGDDDIVASFMALAEGKLLNESAPGYDTRKLGEALPTLESVKAAYESKQENLKEFDELDDGFDEEMEALIKAGPRLNKERFEDVIYYIHNNWMAGNYGDDYAIKRISNYLNAR
jgi:hypothetical protein